MTEARLDRTKILLTQDDGVTFAAANSSEVRLRYEGEMLLEYQGKHFRQESTIALTAQKFLAREHVASAG